MFLFILTSQLFASDNAAVEQATAAIELAPKTFTSKDFTQFSSKSFLDNLKDKYVQIFTTTTQHTCWGADQFERCLIGKFLGFDDQAVCIVMCSSYGWNTIPSLIFFKNILGIEEFRNYKK